MINWALGRLEIWWKYWWFIYKTNKLKNIFLKQYQKEKILIIICFFILQILRGKFLKILKDARMHRWVNKCINAGTKITRWCTIGPTFVL